MIRFQRFAVLALSLSMAYMLGVAVLPVHAQSVQPTAGTGQDFSGLIGGGLNTAAPKALQKTSDLNTIIGRIITSLIGFLGVLLFVYLLYGGFLWMTAGGDAGKVKTAKGVIQDAIIGLVIIAAAYAIANFVITQLSFVVSGQVTPPTPSQ